MPPKKWARVPTPGQHESSTESPEQYIYKTIKDSNNLGLEEQEIKGMTGVLVNCKTRKEIFEWSTSLMLDEEFAAEVIKRRVDVGPPFEGETVVAKAPVKKAGHLKTTKGKKRDMSLNEFQKKKDTATAALKAGLFECGCFATIHNLKGNCGNCGRIICEQESDDKCYFCGFEPERCIAYEIAVQEGKISEAAQSQNKESYEAAIERRDRLLEYAENRAKRTTVIDDQSASLFAPQNAWISAEERREAEKNAAKDERRKRIEAKHRGAHEMHLQFVNSNLALGARERDAGVVTDEAKQQAAVANESSSEGEGDSGEDAAEQRGVAPLPTLLQSIWYNPDGSPEVDKKQQTAPSFAAGGDTQAPALGRPVQAVKEVSKRVQQNYFEDDVSLFVEELRGEAAKELLFNADFVHDNSEDDDVLGDDKASPLTVAPKANLAVRFPPTRVMRAKDEGVCLSMHQPWASMLVAGIKTHEGRVWDTDYRGKLWIHAASAQPVDIKETESHYSQFMSPDQTFPKHYPCRVLLGYVYLTECLDRESYEAAFTPAERQEGCPFSFICVEPKQLPFPLHEWQS
ncbi:hypothetical protein STCU_04164 [Strigomonas culicis]|uniref:Thyroid hormone receptor interactor 4 n=1 Tax=Strigomonas culicis TaxID=28005 RepID=S9UMT4_9TRYP|nr:hypothetical protein STCU_04164 [Strigomonas culicis]|eukprot:EPY30243.1 hypothetical protein STCU_04164 [Strigomonas culicis]